MLPRLRIVALALITRQIHYNDSYNIKMKKCPWKQFYVFDRHYMLVSSVFPFFRTVKRNNQQGNKHNFLRQTQNAMLCADPWGKEIFVSCQASVNNVQF